MSYNTEMHEDFHRDTQSFPDKISWRISMKFLVNLAE
jgi:hypothetical protein